MTNLLRAVGAQSKLAKTVNYTEGACLAEIGMGQYSGFSVVMTITGSGMVASSDTAFLDALDATLHLKIGAHDLGDRVSLKSLIRFLDKKGLKPVVTEHATAATLEFFVPFDVAEIGSIIDVGSNEKLTIDLNWKTISGATGGKVKLSMHNQDGMEIALPIFSETTLNLAASSNGDLKAGIRNVIGFFIEDENAYLSDIDVKRDGKILYNNEFARIREHNTRINSPDTTSGLGDLLHEVYSNNPFDKSTLANGAVEANVKSGSGGTDVYYAFAVGLMFNKNRFELKRQTAGDRADQTIIAKTNRKGYSNTADVLSQMRG